MSLGKGSTFVLEVFNRRLDCVLGEHGAMKLDGWQFKVRCDVLVLNLDRVLDVHACENLGCI